MALIRVLVVDDHPVTLHGVSAMLQTANDIEIVGQVTNSDEMFQLARFRQPDVLILDLGISDKTMPEMVAALRQECPGTKVLIFSGGCCSPSELEELIQSGIVGYVLKSERVENVINAVYTVHEGSLWFSRIVMKCLLPAGESLRGFTERELQILQLLVEEKSDKEISYALGVSERMVRHHLRSLYDKLGVVSRVGAAVQAVQQQLVKIPPDNQSG